MSRVLDLSGQRFSRLVVLEQAGRLNANVVWKCQCDCGAIAHIRSNSLKRNVTKSCGCLQKEVVKRTATTHGRTKTVEFTKWSSMLSRCTNPKHPGYKIYGGRGITVCDAWKDFSVFYRDMGPCPRGLTLERVDNERGYGPDNCKWADMRTQSANTRRVKNSSTGVVGVHARGNGKYRAVIRLEKMRVNIGEFTSISEAADARKAFEVFHGLRSLSDISIDDG